MKLLLLVTTFLLCACSAGDISLNEKYTLYLYGGDEYFIVNGDHKCVVGINIKEIVRTDKFIAGRCEYATSEDIPSEPGYFYINLSTSEVKQGLEQPTWERQLADLGAKLPIKLYTCTQYYRPWLQRDWIGTWIRH